MIEHAGYFLLISFVVALATSAIRLTTREAIIKETKNFFFSLTIGVACFCAVVYALEWVFLRPLL